jgi:hypothetical protein
MRLLRQITEYLRGLDLVDDLAGAVSGDMATVDNIDGGVSLAQPVMSCLAGGLTENLVAGRKRSGPPA